MTSNVPSRMAEVMMLKKRSVSPILAWASFLVSSTVFLALGKLEEVDDGIRHVSGQKLAGLCHHWFEVLVAMTVVVARAYSRRRDSRHPWSRDLFRTSWPPCSLLRSPSERRPPPIPEGHRIFDEDNIEVLLFDFFQQLVEPLVRLVCVKIDVFLRVEVLQALQILQ